MGKVILNATEIQVVKLICRQLTSAEIADKMGLGIRTIEGYRSDIIKKVRARNLVGVALWAVRKGLVRV